MAHFPVFDDRHPCRLFVQLSTFAVVLGVAHPLFGQVDRPTELTPDQVHHEKLEDPHLKMPSERRQTVPALPRGFGAFQSIQVNVDAQGNNILGDAANEPSIAMDPNNPDSLVIGWRQFDSINSNFRQAGVAFTQDGGSTWNNNGPIEPGVFRSDPVLSENSDGSFFYYSLSTNATFDEFFCDMFISEDGGATWSDGIPAGGGDKQWFTIDKSGGQGDGFVHAVWSPFFSCCPSGFFTRSTDDGLNYLTPLPLPVNIFWGTVSVGPEGNVYLSGRDGNNTPHVIRSENAQIGLEIPSFPQVIPVDMGGTHISREGPNPGGLLGQFDIETDHSDGPNRGNVYVVSSMDPPGPDPLDVMFIRSTDGGINWSPPTRINTDVGGAGRYNWFGTMSVAPNGRIDVIWNDMRDDPGGSFSAMFYASSNDGGVTWSDNVQVTPAFDSLIGHPNQDKIGDYYDMRSTNNGVHIAFSATFNGEQDVYYLQINAGEVLLGDVNLDGVVNLLDVGPFVALLTTGDFQVEADLNLDGIVDLLDVGPLVELLSGT